MNIEIDKKAARPSILKYWWLKARRAASGQNYAAVHSSQIDGRLTKFNIFVPALVFALSLCGTVAKAVNVKLVIDFQDIITVVTGFMLAASYYQFTGNHKVRAIEHRQACNEFSALAQLIEATEFSVRDDVAFNEIRNHLERIQRVSPHVPDDDWEHARGKFAERMKGAEANISDLSD